MPPGRYPAALALAVIVLAFTSVAAKECVLGTEPDPSDGGRIKLVLPAPEDPCTCTEVRLGGHNPYARPRPGGEYYIDIRYLKYIFANGLRPLFNCTEGKEDGTSTDKPASIPQATEDAPKTTDKVSTTTAGPGTTPTASTPVDATPVLSSNVVPTEPPENGQGGGQKTTTKSTPTVSTELTPADPTPVLRSTAEPTEPPADCQEISDAGQTTSGVYTIQHAGQNMQVYCRMDSGNGYIVFQRRQNGSVSFDRTWQEYAEGFGNLTGEFWLGNLNLSSLTGDGGWELVITLRAFDGDEARVRYGLLRLETQYWYDRYELVISGFSDESGNAGDSLKGHRDKDFSTRDADYDWKGEKCAEKYRGGWWYGDCGRQSNRFRSNLNGLYYDTATVTEPMQGIQWSTWKGNHVSLKGCEMMTRRRTPLPADCQEILDAGQTASGVYTIEYEYKKMTVYCRMESGRGYIVFQRRQDGSVSFDRTWQEYAEGFGNLTGEFWLGNEKLHSLTGDGGWELVITLRAFDGDEARVRYGLLRLETQYWYDRYELVISGFSGESGNAGDSLRGHRDKDFSTRDADWEGEKCAETFHGGWWYKDCGRQSNQFQSNLNGLYYDNATVPEPMQGIQWSTWKGRQVSLKGCEIMTRRRSTSGPADCQDTLEAGHTTSGVYTIQHKGQDMQVYCHMELGNGYIVFQRRQNGSVSFNRTWQEYAEGFGNLTGEFWLGNQKLYSLTGNWGWELVITLMAFDGEEARVRYGWFQTESPQEQYKLYIGGFRNEKGDAGNSLQKHRGEQFLTRDADNDGAGENCAEKYRGGWWYDDCGSNSKNFQSNLNGLYYDTATVAEPMQGIQWFTWKGNQVSLKGCEMMIRRRW